MTPRGSVRASAATVIATLALLASACTSTGGDGVDVARVSTELAFGAPHEEPVAAPANFNPAPVTSEQATAPLVLPPPFQVPTAPALPEDPDPVIEVRGPENIEVPCPDALRDEFPDLTASRWSADEHKPLPREGISRWTRTGTLQSAESGGVEIDVDGFEQRLRRDVRVESEEVDDDGNRVATTFTYETVQPEVTGAGSVVITRYRVRSDGSSVNVPSPINEDEFTAGESDRGLTLEEIEIQDELGNRVGGFAPTDGLLLMPVPVNPGEQFNSLAIDTRSGQQLTIDGRVLRREQVDACGDMVEGWLVETVVTSTGGGPSFTRQYDYVVAPQYGAVLIGERIEQEGGSELHLEFTLGQQDPDPLQGGAG